MIAGTKHVKLESYVYIPIIQDQCLGKFYCREIWSLRDNILTRGRGTTLNKVTYPHTHKDTIMMDHRTYITLYEILIVQSELIPDATYGICRKDVLTSTRVVRTLMPL